MDRRQFGRVAMKGGAAAALATAGVGGWIHAQHRRQLAAATQPGVVGPNSLQAHAAARGLMYGSAVVAGSLDVEGMARGHSTDAYTQLVTAQTGVLIDEYTMNWRWMRPSPERFDFSVVDRLVRFAGLTNKRVRGSLLCWHEALPRWFRGYANAQNAPGLLADHIRGVVGHLRGQVHSWPVVNEAIEPNDGRPDGLRKSPWLELIGPEYIEQAFFAAAAADPHAKLIYNDYGLETDRAPEPRKRQLVLELLQRLKARGVPVHAMGIQSHLYGAARVAGAGLQSFIRELGRMGMEVHISEMDVNCTRLKGGPEERDARVAKVYREYLDLVLAEPNVTTVLTWGLTNSSSWLRYGWLFNQHDLHRPWANLVDGLRQRPLPFDGDYQPTPAFFALRAALDGAPPRAGYIGG